MNYTTKEYAELAVEANNEGKKIVKINNQVLIVDKESLSFENLKKEKISEINLIYEIKSEKVKADTPQSEIMTWDIQKFEAEAFSKNNQSPTPFVDGLALSRQVDREELLNKVLDKVSSFNAYMAELTGKRQYFEDRIKAAENIEELDNVTWE